MTRQMHLVALKETGHILAAVAQTLAAGDPPVPALVGKDLPVMRPALTGATLPVSTLVPAELLEVKTVAYDSAVLASPLSHAVDGGRVARIPTGAPTGATLQAATTTFPSTTPDVPIVVVLASAADPTVERRAESGKIGTATTLVIAHAILPGDTPAAITAGGQYVVMVACGGRRLEWVTATAT
jgi:hypothetical protein